MKKIIALLLVVVMVAALFVGCAESKKETEAPAGNKTETKSKTETKGNEDTQAKTEPDLVNGGMKVALVTDVGTIDDESFNQATWEGVKQYCEANGVEYTYYQPSADSTDARVETIETAIGAGYNVIVMPGLHGQLQGRPGLRHGLRHGYALHRHLFP